MRNIRITVVIEYGEETTRELRVGMRLKRKAGGSVNHIKGLNAIRSSVRNR